MSNHEKKMFFYKDEHCPQLHIATSPDSEDSSLSEVVLRRPDNCTGRHPITYKQSNYNHIYCFARSANHDYFLFSIITLFGFLFFQRIFAFKNIYIALLFF